MAKTPTLNVRFWQVVDGYRFRLPPSLCELRRTRSLIELRRTSRFIHPTRYRNGIGGRGTVDSSGSACTGSAANCGWGSGGRGI